MWLFISKQHHYETHFGSGCKQEKYRLLVMLYSVNVIVILLHLNVTMYITPY